MGNANSWTILANPKWLFNVQLVFNFTNVYCIKIAIYIFELFLFVQTTKTLLTLLTVPDCNTMLPSLFSLNTYKTNIDFCIIWMYSCLKIWELYWWYKLVVRVFYTMIIPDTVLITQYIYEQTGCLTVYFWVITFLFCR